MMALVPDVGLGPMPCDVRKIQDAALFNRGEEQRTVAVPLTISWVCGHRMLSNGIPIRSDEPRDRIGTNVVVVVVNASAS